jgi:hypothetical protein
MPSDGAVERVAACEHRVRDQPALGERESRADIGGIGRQARIGLAADQVGDRGTRQHRARVADEEAVVRLRHARGGDERVAAAVRAAADVRTIRGAPVGSADQRLGHRRERGDGAVAVVDARLAGRCRSCRSAPRHARHRS